MRADLGSTWLPFAFAAYLLFALVTGVRRVLHGSSAAALPPEVVQPFGAEVASARGRNAAGEEVELAARFDTLAARVQLTWLVAGQDARVVADVALDFAPTALVCWDAGTLAVAGLMAGAPVLERWDVTAPSAGARETPPPRRVRLAARVAMRLGPVRHLFPVHKTRVPTSFEHAPGYLSLREVLALRLRGHELVRVALDEPLLWPVARSVSMGRGVRVPELRRAFTRFEHALGADGTWTVALLAPERDEALLLVDADGDALFDGPADVRHVVPIAEWWRRRDERQHGPP